MITDALQVMLALAFLASGAPKLAGQSASVRMRDRLAQRPAVWLAAGALELAGAFAFIAGLWSPTLTLLGAALLALVLVGALRVHHHHGDALAQHAPAATLLVLVIAIGLCRGLSPGGAR